ncbi:pyridoxal phosphate-dependent transferase [Chaetomium sp. MPI-CAGE-AT-0009]|nr:pyridoxal phosphate-dependent transferase [Chaetomium sp. MPI-CAGE-AT-0009]
MATVSNALRQLAVLGATSAFPPGNPMPLISPKGFRPMGDWSAVDAILANEASDDSKARASQQRFVSKLVPGVGLAGLGHRLLLQQRIGEFLKLDSAHTSVICVTSGTNALRALLKAVRASNGANDSRNEVIVPSLTVGATAEAVIGEGFTPVFVDVDKKSWIISPEATTRCITDKTAAIITVDWLASKRGVKLISDSAQSFGTSPGKPPSVNLAYTTIYSLGYPKVFTRAGSSSVIVYPKLLADILEEHPTGILRYETIAEINAVIYLRALDGLAQSLMGRAAAADIYHQHLGSIPGITFQDVPAAFGLNAKDICSVLKHENVYSSAERMPCIGAKAKFLQYGRAGGDLRVSKWLAANSGTLPISNEIPLDMVKTICALVEAIHQQAADILAAKVKPGPGRASAPAEPANTIDIDSKFLPRPDGKLTVRKIAVGYGIYGNGALWLRRQALFLGASDAMKKTGMFVVSLEVDDKDSEVTLVLSYIPNHSFRELIFTNIGASLAAAAAIIDLLAYKLSAYPEPAKIGPTVLTEIYGNLNIYNILGRLDPEQNKPVALIDPCGVPLLDDSQNKGFECGNYGYNVSKLLFSLTGFSEIRKRLYNFDTDGQSYTLTIQQHPGRNTPWEVVPLFLIGLEKLNDVLDLMSGIGELSTDNPEHSSDFEVQLESADLGAVMIQKIIFTRKSLSTISGWSFDGGGPASARKAWEVG